MLLAAVVYGAVALIAFWLSRKLPTGSRYSFAATAATMLAAPLIAFGASIVAGTATGLPPVQYMQAGLLHAIGGMAVAPFAVWCFRRQRLTMKSS